MKAFRLFIVVSIAASLCACTTRVVDYTLISTKNVDISALRDYSRADSRAIGKDTVHIILGLPTGVPNMKEAIDRAIESTPGANSLVDGVVSRQTWAIPLIYGQDSYIVEGTPLVKMAN